MTKTYERQERQHLTACKQYCLAAGATQGNIAYTQNVIGKVAFAECLLFEGYRKSDSVVFARKL